jgi:hypothetical protein
MSTKPRKTRAPKVKPVLENTDFSPLSDKESDQSEQKQIKPRGRAVAANKNEIVRSRLMLIIDMLSNDNNELDEKTLKHNINISLKHLKEIVGML